jgi:transcriptional regulator
MYVPTHFAVAERADMLALVAANPLGALVRVGAAGLEADHIPFELVAPTDAASPGLF